MTTKHTPGPWHWTRYSSEYGCLEDEKGRDVLRAVSGIVYDEYDSDPPSIEVDAADADLIAAAPELLEALQALDALRGPFSPTDERINEAWAKARAAIAKATGEQQ
ncbi:hypothetical protein [Bordetella genomosp. 4]|uniref:Uncharacterized protein n=1 Tax=Bordetella genomosp. 4 TaxID=463044 RepID=A0A261U4G3_9BORD|nr:hypothetical protein [Bordetella genomosp. 4]OZI56769.1 hypothetical protein CAL20_15325 [Bordetella genomosp. 4]